MSGNNDSAVRQVVFIDSSVPDLQDLLDGLAPDTQAFVLDPGSDGIAQIADILAANDLTGLAAISLVGHGSAGELQLGSASLTDANLAGDAAALASIGASLAPGGALQLYGCDVASGSAGQQFIADLSHLIGGSTVFAASADIGLTPAGENWNLDVSSGSGGAAAASPAVTVTDPFTASAEANFTGTLAPPVPVTELWMTATQGANENLIFYADDTGSGTASNIHTVLDPTSQGALDLFNNDGLDNLQLLQLDTQNDTYILVADGETGTHKIFKGSLSQVLNNPGATPTLATIETDNNSGFITGVAVDAENAPDTVFYDEGKTFDKVSYSGGAVTVLTAAAPDFLDGVALDLPHHVAYFANSDSALTTTTTLNGLPDRSDPNGNIHYIDTITSNSIYETSNLTPSSSSVTISKLADIPIADGSLFDGVGEPGITVDTVNGLIYFTTHAIHTFNVNTGSGIYVYNPTGSPIGGHASGLSVLWTQGTGSGGPPGLLGPIVVDDATGKYYVTMDNTGLGPSGEGGAVYVGNLNANGTTAPTLFTTVATFSSGNVRPDPNGFALDNAPVLTATTTTSTFTESASNPASSNNTPITLLSGVGATDSDNSELTGATISISNGLFTGDALSVTLTGGITVASNTGGVLTLSGASSLANYQTVLNSVKFTSTSDNPTDYDTDTSRTLTFTVSDGLLNSAPVAATVTVVGTDDAPVNGVPGPVSAVEDQPHIISGLSVSDVDADPASQQLTVTLSVLHGTLTLGSVTGLTFNAGANGSATMTFSGTANAINAALAAGGGVSYAPAVNFNTGFGAESLTIVTGDNSHTGSGGPLSDTDSVSITVAAVNDPPNLQPDAPSAVGYIENALATALFAGESINSPLADPDQSANFGGGSVTVAIAAGSVPGDEIVFVPGSLTLSAGTNIQLSGTTIGTLAGNGTATATVSLNANATPTAVNDLVTSFGFLSTSDDPGAGDRTITETFNDGGNTGSGGGLSDSVTQTEHVTPVNDAPTLSGTGGTLTYTENGGGVVLYSGVAASTVEAGQNIAQLVLTVSNVSDGANEILHIDGSDVPLVNGSPTTLNNALTAAVTVLSGTATVTLSKAGGIPASILATILDNLTYRDAGDNPTGGARVVTLTSIKDDGGTANGGQDTTALSLASTVTVVPVNDAPAVTAGGSSTYVEQAGAGVVDNTVTVSDVDSPNLAGATVTISPGTLQTGDTLLFTNTGTITGVYGGGVLTLTGADTPAAYQAALRSVSFENLTNDDPTAGGADLSRTVTWQVNDGSGANNLSTPVTSTIGITAVDDPPTVTAPGSLGASPNVPVIVGGITFADIDSAGGAEKATFTAAAGTFTATTGGGVTVLGSGTGTLSLSGTIANLNSFIGGSHLQFTAPSNDTIQISLDDQNHTGSPDAAPGTASIAVSVDAAPVLNNVPGVASYTENAAAIGLSPAFGQPGAIAVTDADAVEPDITGGTVSIGNFVAGDVLAAVTTGTAITQGYAAGVLTLSGTDTLADYAAVLDSVTFVSTSDNPTNYGTDPTRTLSWSVSDIGGASNAPVSTTLTVTAVDDPPAAVVPGTHYAATEQTNLALQGTGLSVSDIDGGAAPQSETVTLSVGEGTITVAAGNSGVTGLTNNGTGSVSFSGTIAQLNALLGGGGTGTAVYDDNTDTPSASTTLTLSINDNGNTGSGGPLVTTATQTIDIAAVDDPPVASVPGAAYSATEQTNLALQGTGLSVSDVDAGSGSETVTLSVGEGIVTVAAGNSGITGLTNNASGSVSFSGTIAQLNALLSGGGTGTVVYNDNTDTPGASTVLTLAIDDNGHTGSGGPLTATASQTISLTAVNDPPQISAPGSFNGLPNVAFSLTGISFADPDAEGGSETATFSVASGGLRIGNSGPFFPAVTETGTLAQLNSFISGGQLVFDGVANTTLGVTINDQGNTGTPGPQSASTTAPIVLDQPPVVVPGGGTSTFIQNGAAVAVDGGVAVSDADNATLAGATVVIGGFAAGDGDVLAIPAADLSGGTIAGTAIAESFDGATGVLTLSGSDLVANYQMALREVAFSATAANPGAAPRIITFTANDGSLTGSASEALDIHLLPVVTAGASAIYALGGLPAILDPGLAVSDASSATLSGATVSVTSGFAAGDTLSFAGQNGISGVYDGTSGVLTLSGTASLAAYQGALESIAFSGTSLGGRTIGWTVSDGVASSALAASSLQAVPPPVVTAIGQGVAGNQPVAFSPNIFTVAGSGVTEYQAIVDNPAGGVPADGTVTDNGNPVPLGTVIPETSLAGLQFTGGAAPGFDFLVLRAFNGAWSDWSTAVITDQGVAPPVVTAISQNVAAGQPVAFSPNIFTVAGSGITQYQVIVDNPAGGVPADGTVTDNGNPVPLGTVITDSSLGGLQFTGGAAPGQDFLILRAFNGAWSDWTTAVITDQGGASPAPPVVTAISQTVAASQPVAFSPNIFTVAGSGITQYQVIVDNPAGGVPADGTVTDNGNPVPLGTVITDSSLGGFQFTGGASPGQDFLILRAFNGSWSDWTTAVITDQGAPVMTGPLPSLVMTGAGSNLINLGPNQTLQDGPAIYTDTVVGFDATAGDRIGLATDTVANALAHTAQINAGQDTIITLADTSTILLKGVNHIDATAFA